ncbi:MAG: AEC family transporter [Alphaproteobacteria bacterium]
MNSVVSLALPFFGLILLGYACGRRLRYPEAGLQWMSFFIVYLALPALFFKLIAEAPFEQLNNWPFVIGTTLSTFAIFVLSFLVGMIALRGQVREATIGAVAGAYPNIGYMGPGLTLAVFGQEAIVPTALIFVFDNILLFTLVPLLMSFGGAQKMPALEMAWFIARRVVTHPFNIAIAAAILAAWLHVDLPTPIDTMLTFLKNAAAPCALFLMGVTVALREVRTVPAEIPVLLAIKLVLHPLVVWIVLSAIGGFRHEWVMVAVLMAALPPALNVFVLANQYRVYVERASTAILIGTAVSAGTVTLLLWLIAEDRLPTTLF